MNISPGIFCTGMSLSRPETSDFAFDFFRVVRATLVNVYSGFGSICMGGLFCTLFPLVCSTPQLKPAV